MRGADPKMRIDDSDSSSDEDGDSATRSSEEDSPTTEEPLEANTDGQEPTTETEVVFHIPESVKQFLEEDCINVQCHKKVSKVYNN